tara:strand:- start:6027 stop:6179 length:153 start_codon:yes stop_codon:yes gene_type:complete
MSLDEINSDENNISTMDITTEDIEKKAKKRHVTFLFIVFVGLLFARNFLV